MTIPWKIVDDDQLFVYWNGVLVYKRWFRWGQSCVINDYGPNSWNGDRCVNVDGEREQEESA